MRHTRPQWPTHRYKARRGRARRTAPEVPELTTDQLAAQLVTRGLVDPVILGSRPPMPQRPSP